MTSFMQSDKKKNWDLVSSTIHVAFALFIYMEQIPHKTMLWDAS